MKLSEEEQQKYQAFQSSVRSRLARCLFTGSLDDAVEKAVKAVLVNQLQGRSSFSTWVASLGVNIARDYSLKIRQESQVIVGSLKGNQGGSMAVAQSDAFSDRNAEFRLTEQTVRAAIESLPLSLHRRALLMLLLGSTMQEIAAALGKNVDSVKGQLERAKAALIAALVARGLKVIDCF